MPLALRTEGLSKRYPIGQRARYGRLTESLSSALARPFRWARAGSSADESGFIWALRDVSLEVEQGEVLGIIGQNGAGKSTLLKILAGITWPTEGEAEIRGRVGSLLEVGTGFHPELTGRENVFLNGAILGMRKAEIARKFDEIVEFAEVAAFLDTAVKHYSSGMRVRLAFAVAAYLDSEILLIDEVLAVGDYRFQRKCLQTMRQVGETGDTVIFVSHNFPAIRAFCTSCVWVDGGRIVEAGGVDECIKSYTEAYSESSTELDVDVSEAERPPGQGSALRFTRVRLRPDHEDGALRHAEPIKLELEFLVTRTIEEVAMGFSIYSMDGTWVFQCLNTNSGPPYEELTPGTYLVEVEVAENILLEGRYALGVGARSSTEGLDWVREPLEFDVAEQSRPSWWRDPAGQAGIVRPASRFATPRRTEPVHDKAYRERS